MDLNAGCGGGGGGGFSPCRCYCWNISLPIFSFAPPRHCAIYSGRRRVNRAFYLSDANWMQPLLWRASLSRAAGASRVGCRRNNARRPSYRPNYTCAFGRLRFCCPLGKKNLEASRMRHFTQARKFFTCREPWKYRDALGVAPWCCSTIILSMLFNKKL